MVQFTPAPSLAILALLIASVSSTPLSTSDFYERDINELQARDPRHKPWGKVRRPASSSSDSATQPVSGRPDFDPYAGRMPMPSRHKPWGKSRRPASTSSDSATKPVSGRPGFDPYAGRMPMPSRHKPWGKSRSGRHSGDSEGNRSERRPGSGVQSEEYSGRSGESRGRGRHASDALTQEQPWQQQPQQSLYERDILDMEERGWDDHDLDVRGYFDELD